MVVLYKGGTIMFVRTKVIRRGKKEYRYLQLVENQRVKGRVKQKVIFTLGRVEKVNRNQVDQIIAAFGKYTQHAYVLRHIEELHLHNARNWGDVWVLSRLWDEVGLTQILASILIERAIGATVLNRCLDPCSKLATHEWVKQEIAFPEADDIALHHFYRALDFLHQEQEAWEAALYNREMNLFTLDVSLVFYDTTLVSVYGEHPATLAKASRRSRRTHLKELLIGLVLSRDGLPLAHEVLPGNTADVSTVRAVTQRLRTRFGIKRCIFVGDAGMLSQANLEHLEGQEYQYIMGTPLRKLKEVRKRVLATPGRYSSLAENLRIKHVELEGRRYILCHNPKEEARDVALREAFLQSLEAEVASVEGKQETQEYRDVLAHRKKRNYLRVLKDGTLRINRTKARQEARYDGKHVLRTNTELTGAEVAENYHSLKRIEQSFHSLKSIEEVAPVYHWTDERVRGHVAACVLGHWLERLMERKLREGGYSESVSTALRELGRVKSVEVELNDQWFRFRTEASPEVARILKALGYRLPSRVEPLPSLE
jgi:transposase